MIIGLWIHVAGVSFSSQVYQKICLNRVFTKAEKKNKMCICSLTWMAVGAISIWPRGLLRRTNGWADGRCATTTENTFVSLFLSLSEQTKLHPHVRRGITKSYLNRPMTPWLDVGWHQDGMLRTTTIICRSIERPESRKQKQSPLRRWWEIWENLLSFFPLNMCRCRMIN